MHRFPSAFKGIVFVPALICLFFLLKSFCPGRAGESCFADQFAVPIFLPLVAVYKIFGDSSIIFGQEFLFILFFWALTGALVGFLWDLSREEVDLSTSMLQFIKPSAPIVSPTPAKKPPINLLDIKEESPL